MKWYLNRNLWKALLNAETDVYNEYGEDSIYLDTRGPAWKKVINEKLAFNGLIPLIPATRSTALWLNTSHPSPYTVSVGKIMVPPFLIISTAV